ncbi:MAG TPA: hypothetical protein VKD65_12125 [Candidatus Angelobacter sp.]|nr:hypothetical protein [Candidatus Angelobacter sp.]
MQHSLRAVISSTLLMMTLFSYRLAQAQNVDAILDQSFRAMYNLQFDDAFRKADDAKKADKSDPMPWVAQASAVLFREFDRLHILRSDIFISDSAFSSRPANTWNATSRKQFDEALANAEKLAQDRLTRDKKDVKALFALTLMNGLRANDAALITKRNLTALSYTKTATGYAEKLLAVSPDYYDAYIATGMGQYIVGSKPAPVRWILRIGGFKGDQEQGVKELGLVSERGRYLAPFASILLAFNDLRHQKPAEARKKFASLHNQFPGNPLFVQEMEKCERSSVASGQ